MSAHNHPIVRRPQEHTLHIHSPFMYGKTLVALLVLMILTVVLAQVPFPDLHLFGTTIHGTLINNVVAMAIAVTKASLVVMFFMGVKFSTRLTKMWAIIGFVWLPLMFLMLGDYWSRRFEPTPTWNKDQGSALARSVLEAREKNSSDVSHSR